MTGFGSILAESGLSGGLVRRYSWLKGAAVGLLRAFRWAQRMPRLVGPGLGEGLLVSVIATPRASVAVVAAISAVVSALVTGVGRIGGSRTVQRGQKRGSLFVADVGGNRGRGHVHLLLKFRSVTAFIIACCKRMSSGLARIFGNLAEISQLDTWRARMEAD